ncbi:MAG: NAD(P)-dependent oxidoreductase [Pseudomonadota bacterium]
MNVLVTGGAGYIGAILVPDLLAAGHRVVVIDNFMFAQTSLLDCCHDDRLQIVRGDVRDASLLKKHLSGADCIIPLACLVGAPLCRQEPHTAKAVNHDAIAELLAHRSREQIILFPTTNSGYGIGESDIFCTEETPLNPISLYGRLKVDIEKQLLDAGGVITFRLATVFGISPRMRLDLLVNDFTYRAVTDRFIILFEAHFKRNYIHVRDVSRVFLHGMAHFEDMRDRPYNVGLSDANLSKWELCEAIAGEVPDFYFEEASIGEDPDKRNYIVSNERIEATGFRPAHRLQDGIQELVKGYQIIRRHGFSNV